MASHWVAMADTEKHPRLIIYILLVTLTLAFGALWLFCIRLFLIDALPPVSVGEGSIIFIAPLVVVGLSVFSLVSYIRDPGGRGGSVGD